MDVQLVKTIKVSMLVVLFLTTYIGAFAQKPPTGGPNPPAPSSPPVNLFPLIMATAAIPLVSVTRAYIKNRGPKVAVHEHLPAYLLNRNILPTPDALNLMYKLNPRLNNVEVMRANRKLVNPDFPEIPNSLVNTSGSALLPIIAMPASLKDQINLFRSNLNTFQRTNITVKSDNKNTSIAIINNILKETEKDIASYENKKEEGNTIKFQLMTDLFRALNQTLKESITSKTMDERRNTLVREISENLSDLLYPVINNKPSSGKSGHIKFKGTSEDKNMLFAMADPNSMSYAKLNHMMDAQSGSEAAASSTGHQLISNMLQGFAFAIYKLSASGAPITKGPEVEGQYFIQYVMPALKSIPEAYHSLSPPLASFAAGFLPPAKFFFIVKDYNGKQITLQNPLIDTKDAFKNPQLQKVKELIIVPIYISQ